MLLEHRDIVLDSLEISLSFWREWGGDGGGGGGSMSSMLNDVHYYVHFCVRVQH